MNDDLIKRSDAAEVVYKALKTPPLKGVLTDTMSLAITLVRDIPSAGRPQGEWIESFKRVEVKRGAYIGTKFVHDGWSCSECSEVVEKRYPNCPYCLARMKEADNNKECHKPESLYYRAYCEERKDSVYCDGCEFWH